MSERIPEFESREDEAKFWDAVDLEELTPGQLEDADVERSARRLTATFAVRFDERTLEAVRRVARAKGVGATQLVRSWVVERLGLERQSRNRSRDAVPEALPVDPDAQFEYQSRLVTASLLAGAPEIPHFLGAWVQMIGRAEWRLRVREDARLRGGLRETADLDLRPDSGSSSDALVADSMLWVMGAYELVRSLDEIQRKWGQPYSEESGTALNKLKKELEQVRIPLAKLQAPGRQKDPVGSVIAQPVFHPERGVAWVVDQDGEPVLRRDLADRMLDVLVQMGAEVPAAS